jgi:sugar/nucleoside kinase (ribokinase family)
MSLLVTGSIGFDTVLSPAGRSDDHIGGACIYCAAAASLFESVSIAGLVGDDFTEEHIQALDSLRIDHRGLERRSNVKTFRWKVEYLLDFDRRETISVETEILKEPFPRLLDDLAAAEFVALATNHPRTQLQVLDQCRQTKLTVANTIGFWIEAEQDHLRDLLTKIDVLIINKSEAEQLSGHPILTRAADYLRRCGPRLVVITTGQHGCLVCHRGGMGSLPTYPVQHVVDTTGAGDAFMGGVIGYLNAVGDNDFGAIRQALICGTIVASFHVESFGITSILHLTRDEFDARLADYTAWLTARDCDYPWLS